MIRRQIFICLILFLIAFNSKAQYRFQYTTYQQTALAYNPAFTGIEDFVNLKVGYRNRWSGLDGSPTSMYFSGDVAIQEFKNNRYKRRGIRLVEPEAYQRLETSNEFQYRKARRQGFGIWVMRNESGSLEELYGALSYSYHLPISDFIVWSFGASVGFSNSKIDPTGLTVTDPNNDALYQAYLNGFESKTNGLINFGTVIYAKNWYVSYAANNAVSFDFQAFSENPFTEAYGIQQNMMIGFVENVRYGLKLIPSILAEYSGNAPVSFTGSLRLRYEDAIWGGLAYRFKDSASLSVGFYLTENIGLNYSFEYSLSEISGLNTATTHEVILAIKLKNKNFSRAYMW